MFEDIIDDDCVMIDFINNYKEVSIAIKNSISRTIWRTNQRICINRDEKLSFEMGTSNGQITIPAGRICRKQATLTFDGNCAELTNNCTDIMVTLMRGQQVDVKNLEKIEDLYVDVDLINQELNLYSDLKKTQIKHSVSMNSYSGILKLDGNTCGKFIKVNDRWEYSHIAGKASSNIQRGQNMKLYNKQRLIMNGEKISLEYSCQ